jgi:hypothetical protein
LVVSSTSDATVSGSQALVLGKKKRMKRHGRAADPRSTGRPAPGNGGWNSSATPVKDWPTWANVSRRRPWAGSTMSTWSPVTRSRTTKWPKFQNRMLPAGSPRSPATLVLTPRPVRPCRRAVSSRTRAETPSRPALVSARKLGRSLSMPW